MKTTFLIAALASLGSVASAAGVRFVVIDPVTARPVTDSGVTIRSGDSLLYPVTIESGHSFDIEKWRKVDSADRVVTVVQGQTRTIQVPGEPPVKDVYITVSATRLKHSQSDASSGTTKTKSDIAKFGGSTGGDVKQITKTSAGVSEDSGGQQHIRGEHSEITYVVDDIPLPDTLSGRQGAIVVPSTIESVDIILGGFAPEFGGQTAAILNITTLPRAKVAQTDAAFSSGSYGTFNGNVTSVGPLGSKFSYVINLAGNRSKASNEPKQPDVQDAHNDGSDENIFGKFTYQASSRDRLSMTVSTNPDRSQVSNRTGLGDAFAVAGQGYGFLGLRNRDGTRPDVGPGNAGTLGSETIVLPSQQAAGMDINQRESNEFATFGWRHQISDASVAQFGLVFLHSGQDVTNNNPTVDVLNLPVDSAIEYNPTAARNVHHVQLSGSLSNKVGPHSLKFGFVVDNQSGNESYAIVPASQLALDALAATAPNLAPPGASNGKVDVNGNPVYIPTSGASPTLNVHRNGHYYAMYAQDTWKISKRLTANLGVRGDWYRQEQNLGQPIVDSFELSPRANLSYALDKRTVLRLSADRLFNTPPLAQGAIIGQPLQPPIVNQYDIGIERQLTPLQSVKIAYYYKQIKNQIDVGLLIPGSEIGLYSGVNLAQGAVHGLEFSYDVSASKGVGWDGYFNYTLSAAKPNGTDNTGAAVGDYNDHDQRQNLGVGLAYTLKNGASASMTIQFGSGLASSIVPPSTDRTPRSEVSLHLSSGDKLFRGRGGIGIDVLNVFDSREVINFQSAFSGTRFQLGRRFALSATLKF